MSQHREQLTMTRLAQDGEGGFEETSTEEFEFEYQFPFVDVSSKTRSVTHEPIGEPPVVQTLGQEAREITIEGHCYKNEANFIDYLSEDGFVDVTTDRWSGVGVVKSANTKATGEGGGKAGTTQDRLYEYRIVLTEFNSNVPESVIGP